MASNSSPKGFLNTCGRCNAWKSEKIWIPNKDVWEALIVKSGLNTPPDGESDENRDVRIAACGWPGERGASITKLLWWTGGAGSNEGLADFQGWQCCNSSGTRTDPPTVSKYRLQYYYLNRV